MTPEQALSESWQILFGCEFHPESLAARELLEIIHAQRAEAVAEAQKWQPIATAPIDEEILLFIPGYLDQISVGMVGECRTICILPDDSEFKNDGNDHFPTHWMPLPPAPPAKGGEG